MKKIMLTLAVNSSFVHIAMHIRLARMGRESAANVVKGILREFSLSRIHLY